MKLLIIEGNTKSKRDENQQLGAIPYYQRFTKLLEYLGYGQDIDVVFPADIDASLPSVEKMKTYKGIMITGSALNAYQDIPSVTRQLSLLEDAFATGVPIYGSCWGMQIASVVAGGKVAKCALGREFGISEAIQISDKGLNSPYYINKPSVFSSICVHQDEVVAYADNTEILAFNSHTDAQAMTINYKKSQFFGVQYHPEFTPEDILVLTRALSPSLMNQIDMIDDLRGFEAAFTTLLPKTISDYKIHSLEIRNWLYSL